MTDITLTDLTDGTIGGVGVFDKLMAAAKAHLDAEWKKGAITGAEYSTVYLGQVQQILQTAVSFLAQQQQIGLQAELLKQQIELTQAQVDQAKAQTELVRAQLDSVDADNELKEAQKLQIEAQTLNIPKQGAQIEAQTALIGQQQLNEVQQGKNLVAQACLLKAQYDNAMSTTQSINAQVDLYKQKVVTEKAQTTELGVDANSVIGRQKDLYQKQANGFDRDAEQKGAKILIDTWNVRRTTDDGTVADGTNKLADTFIGRAVDKLLTGMQA